MRSLKVRALLWGVAGTLGLSSLLELEVTSIYVRYVCHHFPAILDNSPLLLTLVLRIWLRAAPAWPWEVGVIASYTLLAAPHKQLPLSAAEQIMSLILLWLLFTTMSFLGLWAASLPYRVCC